MKKFITEEYGHWRLCEELRGAFRACIADDSTRFALSYIKVEKDCLVATEGRRLLCIETVHNIPEGLYYLTKDGYMLDDSPDVNFVKWRDVIPNDLKDVTASDVEVNENYVLDLIAYSLNRVGVYFHIEMMLEPIKALCGLLAHPVKIEAKKDGPVKISGDIEHGKFVYLQMPLTKK